MQGLPLVIFLLVLGVAMPIATYIYTHQKEEASIKEYTATEISQLDEMEKLKEYVEKMNIGMRYIKLTRINHSIIGGNFRTCHVRCTSCMHE